MGGEGGRVAEIGMSGCRAGQRRRGGDGVGEGRVQHMRVGLTGGGGRLRGGLGEETALERPGP